MSIPDIEQYANSLSSAFLDEICKNTELADYWVKDVEKKFGSFVHVKKLTIAENEKQNHVCAATVSLFSSGFLAFADRKLVKNIDTQKKALSKDEILNKDDSNNEPSEPDQSGSNVEPSM